MKKGDPDIDRGWAWLVLIVVYLGIIIISTSLYMTGVLYVALLDQFGEDEAKTSLVGALNSGLLCLLGPLASVVMATFSCRVCMFTGGVIASLSCVLSAYVDNIDMLILTYGVFGGIGNALACTTFVVVLGYYFEKRRNIIIAISQAALGIGFFLASPVALAALNTFGLKGVFIFLGSLYAQICVVAVICKPSAIEQRIMGKNIPDYELEVVSVEELKPLNENGNKYDSSRDRNKHESSPDVMQERRISDKINGIKHFDPKLNGLKAIEATNGAVPHRSVEILYEMNGHISVEKAFLSVNKHSNGHGPPAVTCSCIDIPRNPKIVQPKITSSCHDIPRNGFPRLNGKLNSSIDSRVFWSNGMLSNMAASNAFLHEVYPIRDKGDDFYPQLSGTRLWIWRVLNGMCNIHLFKNVPFMLFLISTMTWNFTLSICVMHLPNYMVLNGSGDFEVAAIMTCFSFCNFAGRFIGALTVDRGGLDSLTLHVGMLGVAGIVTLLFPVYAGPIGVYVFAAAVGLYTGGPNSIMTPISLKMVGMEYLSSAHGLERFFCGLGYFSGPPVAGYLFSSSGSYRSSFLCAGAVILLGSFVAMIASVRGHVTTDTDENEKSEDDTYGPERN